MIDSWIQELKNSLQKDNLIQGLQLLKQQGEIKEDSNESYMTQIENAFIKLLRIDQIHKCYTQLLNIHVQKQPIKQQQQKQEQQGVKKEAGPLSFRMINKFQQEEPSYAIAFNNSGSIMVAGSEENIKVYQFEKGTINLLTELNGGGHYIHCLLFSKKNEWFISGDACSGQKCNLKCWKQGKTNTEWLCNQAEQMQKDFINCIVLNKDETQLISGSYDHQIIVWSINYEANGITYEYTLELKHGGQVLGISYNEQETLLVTCGTQIILWAKGQNNRWTYQDKVRIFNYTSRVSFIGETQLIVQQDGKGFTNVFEVVNKELKEQKDLQITLNEPKEKNDNCFFPIIYNKSKDIIILKSHQYVYFIRKQSNSEFKVQSQPLYCETHENFGNLTEDGQYLVIWNKKTEEFKVYQITYC